MAAAFLRADRPTWCVESAGIHPEPAVMANSLRVCRERDWPVPEALPRRWEPTGRRKPDAVWVFSEAAVDAVRRRRPDWPIHLALVPDPIGQGLDAYRRSADALVQSLKLWLSESRTSRA
jgi:protein-tyrosine-phosphatase